MCIICFISSHCLFLCGNKASFITVGSCVVAARHLIMLGCRRCMEGLALYLCEWWCVRIEWERMEMDGHKMLYRKWKWIMLSGSSWHIPKSLINQNSCYFTSSFTSIKSLVDMNGLMSTGAMWADLLLRQMYMRAEIEWK